LSLLSSDRILDSIETYFAMTPDMVALALPATGGAGIPAARLSLRAARELTADPGTPAAGKDAIWSELVRAALAQKDPWELAAVWMMIPGLRRICRRCRRYSAALDAAELEAEAVTGFVAALRTAERGRENLESWLWWTTYRHVHQAIMRTAAETPTADIELIGNLRASRYAESAEPRSLRLINRHGPAAREPGSVSSAAVEGERLGALATRLGLAAAVGADPAGVMQDAA
jgi:hypothetical protein